jgi:HEAT repeat protein
MNVALPGWSTRQQRIAYERIARGYAPDVVVLSICLNDPAELQNNLAKPPPWLSWGYARSALVRSALGASRREIGAVEELFESPEPPRVAAAWARFFDEIKALATEVRRDGARLVLLVNPFRFQVEPEAPPPVAQDRIAAFARDQGFPVIDLLPEVRARGGAPLFIDYDHWTPTGARVVAGILAARLRAMADSRAEGVKEAGFSPRGSRALADSVRERQLLSTRDGGAPSSCELVEEAVRSDSPRIRWAAAIAVFRAGLPGGDCVPVLTEGVSHADARVRRFATWTLGEMGADARPSIPALVARARLDGGAGRTGATAAIAKIGGPAPEAIALFAGELKHQKENRRIRAARALGRLGLGAVPALDALRSALHDESPTVRRLALEAIAGCGEAARVAVDDVVTVMNGDADRDVREAASRTLSRIPGR